MRKQANGAIERCVRRLTVDILAVVKRAVRVQVLEALRAARAGTEAPRPVRGRGKTHRGTQNRAQARGKAQAAASERGKKSTAERGQAAARARDAERANGRSKRSLGGKRTRKASIVEVTDSAVGEGVVLKWPRKRRSRRSNGASRSSNRNGSAKPNGPKSSLLEGALLENGKSAEHTPAPAPLFVHRRKRDGTIQPIERNDAAEQGQTESLD